MEEEEVPRKERGLRSAERFLVEGETVVLASNRHWISMAEPVVTTLAALALVISTSAISGSEAIGSALWWLWFVVLGRLLWRILEWKREWFIATDKRFLLIHGTLVRSIAMMPLNKVTDIKYNRSIPGKLLGYGDFWMETAGQDQAFDHIHPVPRPDETYRSIILHALGGKPKVVPVRPVGNGSRPAGAGGRRKIWRPPWRGRSEPEPQPAPRERPPSGEGERQPSPSHPQGKDPRPADDAKTAPLKVEQGQRSGENDRDLYNSDSPDTEAFSLPVDWKKTTDGEGDHDKPANPGYRGTHPIGSGRRGEFGSGMQPGTGPLLDVRRQHGARWKRGDRG